MTARRNERIAAGLFGLGAALGLSCLSPADGHLGTVPPTCSVTAPLLGQLQTDILFVIDNSDSMKEEQDAIATELPTFVSELQRGSGIAQNFQVGVITTSVYQKAFIPGVGMTYREYPEQSGKLQPVPASTDGGTAGGERILSGSDPALIEKFSRLVQQGTSGSGQETPLEAVRLAVGDLAADGGVNAGFLRPGARLLVVVVSDEDDCSETSRPPNVNVGVGVGIDWCGDKADQLTPVSAYKSGLDHLSDGQGGTREVLWTAIAPVGRTDKTAAATLDGQYLRNVDCPTSNGPGIRHRAMAELFDPTLVNLDSICDPTYHSALVEIAALANTANTVEINNVPDPSLLKVEIQRGDDSVTACTVSNGGITFESPTAEHPGKVHFESKCQREKTDRTVAVKMLCAG